jgi:hypothetical protein
MKDILGYLCNDRHGKVETGGSDVADYEDFLLKVEDGQSAMSMSATPKIGDSAVGVAILSIFTNEVTIFIYYYDST